MGTQVRLPKTIPMFFPIHLADWKGLSGNLVYHDTSHGPIGKIRKGKKNKASERFIRTSMKLEMAR